MVQVHQINVDPGIITLYFGYIIIDYLVVSFVSE